MKDILHGGLQDRLCSHTYTWAFGTHYGYVDLSFFVAFFALKPTLNRENNRYSLKSSRTCRDMPILLVGRLKTILNQLDDSTGASQSQNLMYTYVTSTLLRTYMGYIFTQKENYNKINVQHIYTTNTNMMKHAEIILLVQLLKNAVFNSICT